jgi:hypothetical protein
MPDGALMLAPSGSGSRSAVNAGTRKSAMALPPDKTEASNNMLKQGLPVREQARSRFDMAHTIEVLWHRVRRDL